MSLLADLYHQVFTVRRVANHLTSDIEYLETSQLGTVQPNQRLKKIKPLIRFIMAMHSTHEKLLADGPYDSDDVIWTHLIFSRTSWSLEFAGYRLLALKKDFDLLGTPWQSLSNLTRFTAVCSICFALESHFMCPRGLTTGECYDQFCLLVPRILKELDAKWWVLFITDLRYKHIQLPLWEFDDFMSSVSFLVMSEDQWKEWFYLGNADIVAFKETLGKYLPPLCQFVSSHLWRLEMILDAIDNTTRVDRLESVLDKVAHINKRVTYIWFWLSSFHHYRTLKWMPQMIKKRAKKRIIALRNPTKSE